jgi:hypothetical protein
MTKLYELTDRYNIIKGMLDSDIEGITQESVTQTLASIQDKITDKIASIGKLVLELKSDAEAIKTEEERLAKRRAAATSKIEWLKSYLLTEMQGCNVFKVKQDVISVSVQDNLPSVELIDISQVPEQYVRIIPEVREPDKKAITEHFKQTGEIVSGVNMILDKKHVVIR